MKPACHEKKVKAQKPLDGALEYELYVSAPHQQIIELTEVVEEETPVEKEGVSATRKPASPLERFELVREEPGPERQALKNRAGSIPALMPPTAFAILEPGVYYDSQDFFNTKTAAQALIVPDAMAPMNASFGVPESRKSSWPQSAQYVINPVIKNITSNLF